MADKRYSRRDAARGAVSASLVYGAPLVLPSFARGAQAGPNDRIRLALIGCGVRGKYLIANLPDDAQIVALCDCSLTQIDSARKPSGLFRRPLAGFAQGDARRCAVYQDYRIMLDRERLDGVMIATPDHHHALPAILACQRGIDVYVEKPASLTVAEGRAMVNVARRTKRVVQVGSQQRTMQVNQFACEAVRDGSIGKVHLVRVRNFPGPMRYESLPDRPEAGVAPGDLDWDLFCGPTPLREYDRDLWVKDAYKRGYLTWRGWDLFRSFSGHLMTNWGGHSVDMVHYALGVDGSGPVNVRLQTEEISRYIDDMWHDKTPPLGTLPDDREDRLRFSPVEIQYANDVVLRFDPSVRETVFHAERGKLFLGRNRYRTEPEDLLPAPDPEQQALWAGEGHVARPHIENWFECVRSRLQPNAPIEAGHATATVCHLANIARQLGRSFVWDPVAEQSDDKSVNQRCSRSRRAGFELPAGA